jgi:hypothetical protein
VALLRYGGSAIRRSASSCWNPMCGLVTGTSLNPRSNNRRRRLENLKRGSEIAKVPPLKMRLGGVLAFNDASYRCVN